MGARVVIGLVTPNSLASYFVMFELGARWGGSGFLAPLLAGVKPHELKQPLSLLNALSADNQSHLCQLFENITEHLGMPLQSAACYLANITIVKQLAEKTRSV